MNRRMMALADIQEEWAEEALQLAFYSHDNGLSANDTMLYQLGNPGWNLTRPLSLIQHRAAMRGNSWSVVADKWLRVLEFINQDVQRIYPVEDRLHGPLPLRPEEPGEQAMPQWEADFQPFKADFLRYLQEKSFQADLTRQFRIMVHTHLSGLERVAEGEK